MPATRRSLQPPTTPTPDELDVLRDFARARPAVASPPQPVPQPVDSSPIPVPADEPSPVHFTTRLFPDVDRALKRASLERQLQGKKPYKIQAIVDAALRTWLREQGHLS
jgi:hypothetical protein